MSRVLLLFFLSIFQTTFTQEVEEVIQLDTSSITLNVIYRQPTEGYYFKKVAVYANDTNKIAIEKSFTNYGQNGMTKVFYPSGKLMVSTVYANSKINGDWTWFYENGNIKVKGQYKNGVKHGYWAYKYIKTYGKYKNEKKSGKWKYFDENGIKHLSYYRDGVCYKGTDNQAQAFNIYAPIPESQKTPKIDSSYYPIIHHLNKNYLFRKKFKYFFGNSKKERAALDKHFNYKKDYFKFRVAPTQIPIVLSPFDNYANQKTIENTVIDSVLNNITIPQNESFFADSGLYYQSTDTLAEVIIYFSKPHNNIIKAEILKCVLPKENINYEQFYQSHKCKKWSVLFYIDPNRKIGGIEYEKTQ